MQILPSPSSRGEPSASLPGPEATSASGSPSVSPAGSPAGSAATGIPRDRVLAGDPPSVGFTADLACRDWALPDRIRRLLSIETGDEPLKACLAADRDLAGELRRWIDGPLIRGSISASPTLASPALASPTLASTALASTAAAGTPPGAGTLLGAGNSFAQAPLAAARSGKTDEMRRLAFLAHVRRLFLPDRRIDRYHRGTLWRHSVATAAVSRMIATTCGGPDPGVAFLAGAVHDLGLLASERIHGAAFANLIANVDELSAIHEVERECLGWDHAQLGGEILRHWGLPDAIVVATRYHHAPEIADAEDLPDADVAACVALSNHLCSRTGWSSMGVHNLPAPSGPVLRRLGIDADRLTTIWKGLPATLRDAASLA